MTHCLRLIYSSFALFLVIHGAAAQTPLKIESFSFRQFEGGPQLAQGSKIAEGGVVAFEFRVAGFQTIKGEFEDKVQLEYTATVQDQKGALLAEAISGKIEEEIGQEDKKQNWQPKIEGEFRLPLYLRSEEYKLHVKVTDLVSKDIAPQTFPFSVQGASFDSATTISTRNFQFFRAESDTTPITAAAYRRGDPVWVRFFIAGFHHSSDQKVDVVYGIKLKNEQGKVLFEQPIAAEEVIQSFYSPAYLPGIFNLQPPSNIPQGIYSIEVTINDRIANQVNTDRYTFSIE